MQIRLYLDEDAMDGNLVWALRVRGLEVVTALDAGLIQTPDLKHLEYASLHGRTLYSFNVSDFMSPSYIVCGGGQTSRRDHTRSATTLQRRRADAAIGAPCPNALR